MPFPFNQTRNEGGESYQQMTRVPNAVRQQQRNRSLPGVLTSQFEPELGRIDAALPGLEELLLGQINAPIDYSAFKAPLEDFAGGLTKELYGPGGYVEEATQGALGMTQKTGFGPTSGGFDRARLNILGGANDQFANALSGKAVELANLASSTRDSNIRNLLAYTGNLQARRDDYATSLFTGRQAINQYGMDRNIFDLNRRMVEHALKEGGWQDRIFNTLSGAAEGAIIGSMTGGPGAIPGAIYGGISGATGG